MGKRIVGELIAGASVRVGELRPAEFLGKRDLVTVPCVFAPDNSRVAWTCGNKRVLILPWNADRNCLVRDNDRDAEGQQLSAKEVTISTGQHVTSMSFWMGSAGGGYQRRGSWKRNDFRRISALATGHSNGRIRLWSLDGGSLLLELCDHRGAVRDLAFAPDNSLRLVSASTDKTLKAWDLEDDGNMYKTMTECRAPVLRCTWSPDGSQLVASGNSKLVFVFDMNNKCSLRRTLEGHYHQVTSCSFSFDGSLIISSSLDTRAIVWDAATGRPLHSLGHLTPPPRLIFASGENGAWVKAAAMSRSMCQTVTVCEDGYLRFWNVLESGAEPAVSVLVPRVNEDEMLISCAFNGSGSVVVVGTCHGSVSFFTVPRHIPSLCHLARRTVRRLTSSDDVKKLQVPSFIESYLLYSAE